MYTQFQPAGRKRPLAAMLGLVCLLSGFAGICRAQSLSLAEEARRIKLQRSFAAMRLQSPVPLPVDVLPPASAPLASSGPSPAADAAVHDSPVVIEPVKDEPVSQPAADEVNQPAPPPATAAAAQDNPAETGNAPALSVRTVFKVKYVADGAVYLGAGRSAGLVEGMNLTVKRPGTGTDTAPTDVAELQVSAVADASAVCDIKQGSGEIRPGDLAYLSQSDAENESTSRALGSGRKYPQTITFSEGDPLDEEARDEIPRPPLPEINRARGRIGLDFGGIRSRGAGATSSSNQLGGVFRADVTRIAGTYWNLSGYWRGRFQSRSFAGEPTLQDLINRTYHLTLTYDSPVSHWVAGFGRLYLPWASSLDTIDGGYFGRKLGKSVVAGVFGGTTPDPTSWNYNPNRRIAGTFLAFEGGSFDTVHYTSTAGLALTSIGWTLERPFLFFENGIFFKRYVSIYHSAQVDNPNPPPGMPKPGAGLSRSFLTLRIQPNSRVSFDINHNYFRDVPTFATQLIGTGLLDTSLFQGFSAGVRVRPWRQLAVFSDIGRSDRTGDRTPSTNQLYGASWDRIWKTGLRAEFRTSRFDGSFGSGSYRSLSLSRELGDRLHFQVQAGRQTLLSTLTSQGGSRFVNGSLDASFGPHYFFQADFTAQRGAMLDYDQWIFTWGYRFDNRSRLRDKP